MDAVITLLTMFTKFLFITCPLSPLKNIDGWSGFDEPWSDRYPSSTCLYSWAHQRDEYSTCSAKGNNNTPQNCSINSKEYMVENIKYLFLNIITKSTPCSLQSHPKCQENISLYYSLKDNLQEKDNFIFLSKVPKELGSLKVNSIQKITALKIETKLHKYVKFSFNTQFYCGRITAFRPYYRYCVDETNELIEFNKTEAPRDGSIKIIGTCTANSSSNSPSSEIFQTCTSDGRSTISAICQCNPGFTKVLKKCKQCKFGEYKSEIGNHACSKCGSFSVPETSKCLCKKGYYRAYTETKDFSKPCRKMPQKITGDINVALIDNTSLNVSWTNAYEGDDFYGYLVQCNACVKKFQHVITLNKYIVLKDLISTLSYNISVSIWNSVTNVTRRTNPKSIIVEVPELPGSTIAGKITVNIISSSRVKVSWNYSRYIDGFHGYYFDCIPCPKSYRNVLTNSSFIVLKELSAFTKYNVYVSMETDKTKNESTKIEKVFTTTDGALPAVQNVRKKYYKEGAIMLTWEIAKISAKKQLIMFEIEFHGKEILTKEHFFTFNKSLLKNMSLPFNAKISMIVTKGKETYKGVATIVEIARQKYQTDKYVADIQDGIATDVFIGSLFGVSIIFIVFILFLIYMMKRKKIRMSYKQFNEVKLSPHEYINLTEKTSNPSKEEQYLETIINEPDSFIDRIEEGNVETGDIIETSDYAIVHNGTLIKDGQKISVAVTILKSNVEKSLCNKLMIEAALMNHFNHPNIISVYGSTLKDSSKLIVSEYMEKGPLDKYLQRNNSMEKSMLVKISHNVAFGMKYLAEKRYIHKTLSARNILVDKNGICKLLLIQWTDEVNETTYQNRESIASLRWSALELLEREEHSMESVVWSFGIVLWEIWSYGEQPYWSFSNQEVVEKVKRGYRLPPPANCPKVIYEMMLQCWDEGKTKRPSFETIKDKLEHYFINLEELEEKAGEESLIYESPYYTGPPDIERWLQKIDMGIYSSKFASKGLVTIDQVVVLSEEDLMDVGVIPIAHRRKVFQAIQSLIRQNGS